MHVHTKYSGDSSINPKTVVDRLFADDSVKVAAITDHNTVEGCTKVQELAKTYKDILIIPGVEITTPEGDLLILGVAEMPIGFLNVKDVIDFARKRDGVVIVAHPFREYGLGSLTKNYEVDRKSVV